MRPSWKHIDPFVVVASSIRLAHVQENVRIVDSDDKQQLSTRDPFKLLDSAGADRYFDTVLILDTASTNVGEAIHGIPIAAFFPRKMLPALAKIEDDSREFDMHRYEAIVDNSIKVVSQGSFISADMSLLKFLDRERFLRDDDFFVVLDGVDWTGVITPELFQHPLTQICFLAIVFDLEVVAMKLIQLTAKECFKNLPETRQQKTLQTFLIRNQFQGNRSAISLDILENTVGEGIYSQLLNATTLIDRGTMIRKSKLTIDLPNKQIERVFGRAERIRNALAHPSDEDELSTPYPTREMGGIFREIRQASYVLMETYDREINVRKSNVL